MYQKQQYPDSELPPGRDGKLRNKDIEILKELRKRLGI